MQRLSCVLLVVAAACGGSKSGSQTTTPTGGGGGGSAEVEDENAPVVGPPQVAWKDMDHKQRGRFMAKVVMPKMKPIFQAFDAKGFENFTCETCHGEGAKTHKFDMPNPDIFVLPEKEEDFKTLAAKKGDWMKFMGGQVTPTMAGLLGMPEFDPAKPDPNAFGCYGCHTHKDAPPAE